MDYILERQLQQHNKVRKTEFCLWCSQHWKQHLQCPHYSTLATSSFQMGNFFSSKRWAMDIIQYSYWNCNKSFFSDTQAYVHHKWNSVFLHYICCSSLRRDISKCRQTNKKCAKTLFFLFGWTRSLILQVMNMSAVSSSVYFTYVLQNQYSVCTVSLVFFCNYIFGFSMQLPLPHV